MSRTPLKTGCPICGRPPGKQESPFCSKRCADLDLGRWLTNSYAIPVEEDESDEGAAPASPRLPGHDPSA